MEQETTDLIKAIEEYKKPGVLQKRYKAFITDKKIPLADRWEVFRVAPSDWQESNTYIQHFAIEKKVGEIEWYDKFYYERHETVHMYDFVDRIIENIEDEDEDTWTVELVDEFKEEILSRNLASFDFDW